MALLPRAVDSAAIVSSGPKRIALLIGRTSVWCRNLQSLAGLYDANVTTAWMIPELCTKSLDGIEGA